MISKNDTSLLGGYRFFHDDLGGDIGFVPVDLGGYKFLPGVQRGIGFSRAKM